MFITYMLILSLWNLHCAPGPNLIARTTLRFARGREAEKMGQVKVGRLVGRKVRRKQENRRAYGSFQEKEREKK